LTPLELLKPRQRPFLFWLLTIQFVAVIPVLGLAAWAMHQLGQRNQQIVIGDLQARVDAAADALAREAVRLRTRLRLLSNREEVSGGDADAMYSAVIRHASGLALVSRISILGGKGEPLLIMDLEGSSVASAVRGADLGRLVSGSQIVVDPIVNDASGLGHRIDMTLHLRTEGSTVARSVRFVLRPEGLGEVLRAQRWPESWTAALLDQDLTIVTRSRDEAKFMGQPASPSLQALVRDGTPGVRFARTKDGIESVTVTKRVEGTPWLVVAGVPRTAIEEEANGPLHRVLAGGAVLASLGIVMALWLSRRLNQEMGQAARGAGITRGIVKEFGSIRAKHLMLENDLVGMVQLVARRSVWHNPAFEKIFGYGPGELEGHSPRQMHEDDESFDEFGQRAYAALESGVPFREQLRMVCKDGSLIWVDVSGVGLADGSTLWMLLDVSAQRAERDRMADLAFRDPLTGLPNRAFLEDRLKQEIAAAARLKRPFAACMLDLNGFKAVNDNHGHAAGDALLRSIGVRLHGCMRPYDMVARLGGDEFVVMLTHQEDTDGISKVVDRIRAAVREPVRFGETTFSVEAAVGIAIYPNDSLDIDGLMALADANMYVDKATLKNRKD
jgi:diguanylate cyclase (GGDEF)-like protein/PAS domain S-box-containing protein